MIVSLNLDPELEERLAARARSRGLSLESFIHRILEDEATAFTEVPETSVPLTGIHKAGEFEAW